MRSDCHFFLNGLAMKLFNVLVMIVLFATFSNPVRAAEHSRRPLNLLFIITDQQRWDAMSCSGNKVLKTPNLDRLARDGARFTRFYSACPVCVPARTSILTGHSTEANGVLSNDDVDKPGVPPFPSFDQILLRHGYRGEYHGKYHSPYQLALEYTEPVRWLNGKRPPPDSKATISDADAFKRFIEAHVPTRDLRPGELRQRNGIYAPIPLDENYGKASPTKGTQSEAYGKLDVSPEYTLAAFTAKEGLAALERLKNGPFTLTISLDPPHPPMVVSEPYYSMYPPDTIPVSPSLEDSLANSPYQEKAAREGAGYRDAANIRQMTSIYYGMVSEVDDWIGKILKRLDELHLSESTLVVFTSDHGELLGDHGMHGKFVFYEGSVHVPLLIRLPGVITPNTVIDIPASHIDLFPTILDYLDQPGHETNGESLRPLIEGSDAGHDRVAVSEWPSKALPGFMVCDGRWKLMFGVSAAARSLDALYDLQSDPHELNNLIGRNPAREKHRAAAQRMKSFLVSWLERTKSRQLEAVESRSVIGN